LHTKGWGLFKLGKYQTSFDILQRSWDLITKDGGFDTFTYIHLDSAKKAVAELKNN
jgi:hypothetical protein